MRTVLFNGPFISEIDAGYNVQANGVSINFLKNPFCFKSGFLSSINDTNNTSERLDSLTHLGKNVKVLKPLTKIEYVEVPKYIYEERIIDKIEIVNKNVYVPYDGPIYRTKEVKVPVYKEKIKYVPVHVEREKLYEIPKLEIHDLIQENLLYLHKHNIEYKNLNHVVERVIPILNKKVVEKISTPPSIEIITDMPKSTNVSVHHSSSSSSVSKNEHVESQLLNNEEKNDYTDILSHENENQVLVETEESSSNSHIHIHTQDEIIEEKEEEQEEELLITQAENKQDNNSGIHYSNENKNEQTHLSEGMDKMKTEFNEQKIETEKNNLFGAYRALPSLNLSSLINKKEKKTFDENLSKEGCLEKSVDYSLSKKSSVDSLVKMVCSREYSYGDNSSNLSDMY